MPGADNTIEVDQFMVVKNVCKIYEQFTRLFAPYTVKKLSKLTCFVTQYLTENSKDWVSISCLHVKITDVRIETFQNKKCYIKTVACISTKNTKIIIFFVLVLCTQVNMMFMMLLWASIPKVVGSIPTVARHISQACPVWIYTE
jgi:hypothetical protein